MHSTEPHTKRMRRGLTSLPRSPPQSRLSDEQVTDPEDLENIKQCLTRMLNTQYSMNLHKSSINENSVRPGQFKPTKSVQERQKADLLYSLMDRRGPKLLFPGVSRVSSRRRGGSWGASCSLRRSYAAGRRPFALRHAAFVRGGRLCSLPRPLPC